MTNVPFIPLEHILFFHVIKILNEYEYYFSKSKKNQARAAYWKC